MATDAKGYARQVLSGYAYSIQSLKSRYDSLISEIDKSHDKKANEINASARAKKNESDAANKISLNNTKAGMLDKGLSRSGASVQADIDHNIAGRSSIAKIETDAAAERSANETSRANEKSQALRDYISGVAAIEKEGNEAYIAQLNRDREYEASRDDEMNDRDMENRKFEAERDDEKHDRYVENRAYEAERDDEKHDRYVENRAYEADRDDEKHDRYVENRAYEAERDDEQYDRYADNRDYQASRDDEQYDRDADFRDYAADRNDEIYDRYADVRDFETEQGESGSEGVDPSIAPRTLVDKIRTVYNSKKYSSEEERKKGIKGVIDTIVNDETLSYDFRYEVQMYAEAIGLY